MTGVVQATCPACKKVLRIPSDWVNQPIRCKHCRAMIQARPTGPTNRPTPPPPSHTVRPAVPPRRGAVVPPPPIPVAPPGAMTAVPPPIPIPVAQTPLPVPTPVAVPVPGVHRGPPVAMPVAGMPAAEPSSLFVGIEEGPSRPSRRRRRGRGAMTGLLIGLALLGIAAGSVWALWPEIAPLFDKKTQVAKKDTEKAAPVTPKKKPVSTPKGTDPKPPVSGPGKTPDRKPPEKPIDPKPPQPDPTKPPKKPNEKPPPSSGVFPRRALIISIHNYLYANPIHFGDPGSPRSPGRNFHTLLGRLPRQNSFHISPAQIAHLSDAAQPPNPPVKSVIEQTLTGFLKQSRGQDHLLIYFAGHGVEIDGEAYLVPIEGELGVASTLIPLKWVYKQLEDCKARQKVLIIDVCRHNTSRGSERPAEGPMSPKFDLALKNPPKGVQVWTACIENQQSYEFEDIRLNNGLFLDAFYEAVDHGVQGVIQRPDAPFPLEQMVTSVNQHLKEYLDPLKLTQTSRLSGTLPDNGAPYDPNEPLSASPVVAKLDAGKGLAESRLVQGILRELNVPPVKKSQEEGLLRYESMPPFLTKALDTYPVDNTPTPLREAIEKAQAMLWALSANNPPADLTAAVQKIKSSGELKSNLNGLREEFRAPGGGRAEMQFKKLVEDEGRKVASMIRLLDESLAALTSAGKMRDQASKRWQANYDFILARLENQLAYVYEYSSMLGQMRKEFPPRDPAVQNGWRLGSTERLRGDSTGRKLARDAKRLLDKIVEQNAGTPWEVLAKREKLTALGLEWKAVK
jgi:Caspase domain